MEGLLSLLMFAALFYVMMRFGCGAHMVHGHGAHGSHHDRASATIDPVCGMSVAPDDGYTKRHAGQTYHFCSRKCLDTFEANPDKFNIAA
jgi:YHS domain-containing protein